MLILLAQQSSPETVLLERGVLGLAVFALGWISYFMFKRMVRENEDLKGQRDEMVQTIMETVPLLKKSNEIHEMRQRADDDQKSVNKEAMEILRTLQSDMSDIRRRLLER